MSRQQSKVAKVRGPRQNLKKRQGTGVTTVATIPKAGSKIPRMSQVVPDKVIVPLKYIFNGILNNAAGMIASKSFKGNSAFDIDPAVGSQAIPGFAEWAAFFQNYRVRKVGYRAEFMTRDASIPYIGALAAVVPHITPFTANTFGVANYENARSKVVLLSAQNGKPIIMKGSFPLHEIVGDVACYTDDDYGSTTNTNPNNLVFLTVSYSTEPIATAIVAGMAMRLEIFQDCEFYNRRVLIS